MNINNSLIRDAFGRAYHLTTNTFEKPHCGANAKNFFCPELAANFVRSLRFPEGGLRKFIITNTCEENLKQLSDSDIVRIISQYLVKGKLTVFEYPPLEKKAVTDQKGSAWRFVKGPDHYPGSNAKPFFILNQNEAEKIVSSLKDSPEFWHKVLKENDVLPAKLKPGSTSLSEYHKFVIDLLVKGEMLIYRTKDATRPPREKKSDQVENAANTPGNRQAHLVSDFGPAREVNTNKVQTDKEKACAELDKCEIDDKEAAEKAGMLDKDLQAIKETCEENNATITFRDTNPACKPHLEAGVPSKGSDVKTKTFKAECLPDAYKGNAGLVSNCKSMPKDGVLKGDDLIPYQDGKGNQLTGDYDMHDMIDATTGERIVGESDRDKALRKEMNEAIGEPDRIMHGAQANYMDYCNKEKIDPETHLLQADPPVTMVDGKSPVTLYRIENDEQLLNMYNCKGTPVPEQWSFERKQA